MDTMESKIKYIELKTDGVRGVGRIGIVDSSKSGKTLYYNTKVLAPLKGWAAKANYYDEETGEEYWVSSPRKDGRDSLFPAIIEIDENAREEYWLRLRSLPQNITQSSYSSPGRSKKEREKVENSVRRHDIDRRFRAP
jgi:hypothetical protein